MISKAASIDLKRSSGRSAYNLSVSVIFQGFKVLALVFLVFSFIKIGALVVNSWFGGLLTVESSWLAEMGEV